MTSFWRAVTLVSVLFMLEAPVHGYLDPGMGSMVAQAVIALVTGGMLVFRRRLDQIRSRVVSLLRRDSKESAGSD